MIKAGTYRAKAVGGVFGQFGQKQTPGVEVTFQVGSDTIRHTLYLTNTQLKDGSTVLEKTFNTLVGVLGFNESKALQPGPNNTHAFDASYLSDKEVEIVVEDEPGYKDPTKTYTKVRYINEIRGSRVVGAALSQILGNQDLKALCASARARMGSTVQTTEEFDLF